MDTKTKVEILNAVRMATAHVESWQPFLRWADLGLPLAQLVSLGYVTLDSDEAVKLIDSTYDMLLKVLGIPDVEYSDLAAVFDAAADAADAE